MNAQPQQKASSQKKTLCPHGYEEKIYLGLRLLTTGGKEHIFYCERCGNIQRRLPP